MILTLQYLITMHQRANVRPHDPYLATSLLLLCPANRSDPIPTPHATARANNRTSCRHPPPTSRFDPNPSNPNFSHHVLSFTGKCSQFKSVSFTTSLHNDEAGIKAGDGKEKKNVESGRYEGRRKEVKQAARIPCRAAWIVINYSRCTPSI